MKRINVLLVLLLSAGISVYAQKKCVPSEDLTTPVLQEEAAPSCAAPKEVEPTKFDNWFVEGWGMNMSFGPTIFVGDVSKSSKVKAMIGLGVQKELNPHIYWRLNGAYGQLSGEKDKYESGGDANLKFSNKFTEINTSLKSHTKENIFNTLKKRKNKKKIIITLTETIEICNIKYYRNILRKYLLNKITG